jgi:hypothetical protein
MLKKLTVKPFDPRTKMIEERYARIDLCGDACNMSCGDLGPSKDIRNELFREKI